MRLIDTNILLRYLTGDDKTKAQRVLILLKEIENDKKEAEILSVSAFEVIYTLESFYKISRKKIQEILTPVFGMRNLKLADKDVYFEAMEIWANKNISFADAFNMAFAMKNNIAEIYSYDKDFDKMKFLKRLEP